MTLSEKKANLFGQKDFLFLNLNKFAQRLAAGAWASLYQQRPTAAEGRSLQAELVAILPAATYGPFNRVVQSWDTAFKKGNRKRLQCLHDLGCS